MEQRTAATVPPGWQLVAQVDSRLEADLAARMLDARDIASVVTERGPVDFAVHVAPDDRESAEQTLDVA